MAAPSETTIAKRAARSAGLRYTSDEDPGWSRRRRGNGFQYTTQRGGRLTKAQTARAKALVIPPAWTDVWICRYANGHLQATGRDARGRKQYRYHERWREVRDHAKYDQMADFGRALPRIRNRVDRDLRGRTLTKQRVVAAVVRLLDETTLRIGNDEYARDNGSYGLTTLRDRHVRAGSRRIVLRFTAKSGKQSETELDDARLARLVHRLQDLPGQRVFRYVAPDGRIENVTSDDVNAYLARGAGAFTAKDFRTWHGTVLAAWALDDLGPPGSPTDEERQVVSAVDRVAAELGNTRAVCRRSYIHPGVIDAHRAGKLHRLLHRRGRRPRGLDRHEAGVLTLLEHL